MAVQPVQPSRGAQPQRGGHRAPSGRRKNARKRAWRRLTRPGPSPVVRALIVVALVLAVLASGALVWTLLRTEDPYTPTFPSAAPTTAYPLTVTLDGGPIVINSQPRRVVSLDPSATSILQALGAAAQLVAVDPRSAKLINDSPLAIIQPPAQPSVASGQDRFTTPTVRPDQASRYVESIMGHKPDLVILPPELPASIGEYLDRRRVPYLSLLSPDSFQRSLDMVDLVALVTGHSGQGQKLGMQMRDDLAQLSQQVQQLNQQRGRLLNIYYESPTDALIDAFFPLITQWVPLSPSLQHFPYYSSTDYARMGDYAQALKDLKPQPDLVLLATGQTRQQVLDRRGWNQVRALQSPRSVVQIDPIQATLQGPQQIQLLRQIVQTVQQLPIN